MSIETQQSSEKIKNPEQIENSDKLKKGPEGKDWYSEDKTDKKIERQTKLDSYKTVLSSFGKELESINLEKDKEKKMQDFALLYVGVDSYQKEISNIALKVPKINSTFNEGENLDNSCDEFKDKIMENSGDKVKLNEMISQLFYKISNKDFLKYTAKDQRLEKITKPPKEAKDVKSGDDIRFTFTFENKLNENLYLKTTAGQVLPSEVREVEFDGVKYSRNSIGGEFFTASNERLLIHEGTQIKIGKVGTSEEITKMSKENDLKVAEYLKQNPEAKENEKIVSESINRGIDPKFAILTFSDLIKGKTDENEIDAVLEDAFTEFDRTRGKVEASGKMEVVKEGQQGRYDENLIINLLKVLFPGLWKEKAISTGFSENEINNFETVSNTKIDFSTLNGDTNKMISETGKNLGINEKLIKSILMQESSGNMAATRFEKHVYDRELKKGNPPETAKLLATSFGGFQIMGFNYETCGYKSVQEFVDAMKNPEEQFNAFAKFVKSKGSLYNAMKKEPPDFQAIAYNYNGPGYAQNNYDKMIEKRFYA
ncbi:MAG: N-acetylmuramidase domain-containing protein [Candidatus Gracilibacteria bacterium]